MFQIDPALVSLDLVEKNFICNLTICKGGCCVQGSSGAPLLPDETVQLEKVYPVIKNRLTPEGIETIEKNGTWIVDKDNDKVTPLMPSGPCVYTVIDQTGVTKCAIELAWKDGEVEFQKPVSCHLYPVRITKYDGFEAINYEEIEICKAGLVKGERLGVPLYKFLKDALTRRYGAEWYAQLDLMATEWLKQKKRKR
jgi:hypothetical protein